MNVISNREHLAMKRIAMVDLTVFVIGLWGAIVLAAPLTITNIVWFAQFHFMAGLYSYFIWHFRPGGPSLNLTRWNFGTTATLVGFLTLGFLGLLVIVLGDIYRAAKLSSLTVVTCKG